MGIPALLPLTLHHFLPAAWILSLISVALSMIYGANGQEKRLFLQPKHLPLLNKPSNLCARCFNPYVKG